MRYHFTHPDDSSIQFVYDAELPMMIEKRFEQRTQRITLIHKNVNAEEFFLCLITSKEVYIKNKFEGYAFRDEKKCPIDRPYDCKWAVHTLLDISKGNPLIIHDRNEHRYIWPFSDDEMMRIPHLGQAHEDNRSFAQEIHQAKKRFESKREQWKDEFSAHRHQALEKSTRFQAETDQWFADKSILMDQKTRVFEEKQKMIRDEMYQSEDSGSSDS